VGVLAVVAGLIFAVHLNIATLRVGNGFELDAIAAAFIGGASVSGGLDKVIGVVIGTPIMGGAEQWHSWASALTTSK